MGESKEAPAAVFGSIAGHALMNFHVQDPTRDGCFRGRWIRRSVSMRVYTCYV